MARFGTLTISSAVRKHAQEGDGDALAAATLRHGRWVAVGRATAVALDRVRRVWLDHDYEGIVLWLDVEGGPTDGGMDVGIGLNHDVSPNTYDALLAAILADLDGTPGAYEALAEHTAVLDPMTSLRRHTAPTW